jgi:hypothetical protein
MEVVIMESFGIKTTIYDSFSYFIPGVVLTVCIVCAIYFSNYTFSFPINDALGDELLNLIPGWFFILVAIIIMYVFGLLISTLSSIVIEKGIMGNISWLRRYFLLNTILSKNTYNLFVQICTVDFCVPLEEIDKRLLIVSVENRAVNSYKTAFVFLSLYGTNRSLSLILFSVGIVNFIFNITHHGFLIFGIVLIILSIIAFIGYIRFYRYFIRHIVSAYLSTKKSTV